MVLAERTVLILTACFLFGCGSDDYFPDNVGNTWSFMSDDSMHRTVWNFCGWGFMATDTAPVQLLAIGRDTFGFVKTGDSVFLTGTVAARTKLRTVFLKLPLKAGASWVAVPEPDSSVARFECFEDVVAPVGKFRRCARVSYRGPGKDTRIWFCPGKGPVQIASRNPFGQDSALSTKILKLVEMRLTRERPRRPTGRERDSLLVRSRERHVIRGMRILQRVMESYGQDHAGNFPPPGISWLAGDTTGIAVLLPEGNPGRIMGVPSGPKVPGRFPWNPFTGEDYQYGKDLFYFPDTLAAPGRNAITSTVDSLCPFRLMRPPKGIPGTIMILGYTPPDAVDSQPSEYAIIGFGRADREPILETRPAGQDSLPASGPHYFVIHNP